MLYTCDSLCNNVDISAFAEIPCFDKPKRYLPRNDSIVAKATTCKHYTCCIHVIAFATTLTFLNMQEFHILINKNASLLKNVSIVANAAKAITCKHYTCCIHVIAFATALTFLQMLGFDILINQNASLPRNVSIVSKAV